MSEYREWQENAEGIRNFLQATIELHKLHPGVAGQWDQVCRYVLENESEENPARPGRPLPAEYERGEIKLCFMNAARLAWEDADLTYCEGYATTGLLPVHHAWCIDLDGLVVDPTWQYDHDGYARDPTTWAYIGVSFPADTLNRALVETETWGVLDWAGLYEENVA